MKKNHSGVCTTTFESGSEAFVEECWGDDAKRLRSVAATKLRTDWLQIWWSKKYNRPLKDPLLLSYTPEELQIEYFIEWIETDPAQAYPQNGKDMQFRTGDKVIDGWEEQLAKGETPDFESDIDPDFLAKFKRYSRKTAQEAHPGLATVESSEHTEDLDEEGGFADTY